MSLIKDVIQTEAIDIALNEAFDSQNTSGQSDNPDQMEDKELIAIIESESSNAHGEEDSELSADRSKAMDYYFNRPRGDEVKGRSQVQSSDVMDVIEWMLPDLIEAFTTNDEAVLFQANGAKDKDRALMESRYINHVFHNDTKGYLLLYNFFKDALMLKNGIAKVYRSETLHMEYATYDGLTESELSEVLDTEEGTEIETLEHDTETHQLNSFSEELQQEYRMLPEVQQQIAIIMKQAEQDVIRGMQESGYNMMALTQQDQQLMQQGIQESAMEGLASVVVNLYSIKIRIFIKDDHSVAEAIAPEEFEINNDHNSIDVDDARYTCHRSLKTASDLIEMGYDPGVIADLAETNSQLSEDNQSRQYHAINDVKNGGLDESVKTILVRDVYMKVDFDKDGIAELRHILVAGDTVLENDYCDDMPFVCISPIMIPHRWVGVSMYDRIKQIQDIGTSVWRQLLDNMYRMNNARTIVVENQVNMDDVLNSRAGGVVRAKSIDSIAPFPHTPIGNEAYQMMQQLSRTRMERSGVGPEMMAEGMVIENDTAHGVERLMAAKEKLLGVIIRNFAETGVSKIFCKLHSLERKHQNKECEIEVNGSYVKFKPWRWIRRNKTRIKVGLGAGDKMKHAVTMEGILLKQEKLLQAGYSDVLVTTDNIYNALNDSVRFNGINASEAYFTNPKSPQAQQAAQAKAEAASEPSIDDKIIMLTAQIEQKDAQLKEMKQGQNFIKDADEQERKWKKDIDESEREWTSLEIEANKDLGEEGRAL